MDFNLKIKKFLKTYYFGFLLFALGLGIFLLARFHAVFILLSCLCFIAGSVLNLILAIKQFRKDKEEIDIKLAKIQQILAKENESAEPEQIEINNKALETLGSDANKFKLSKVINILIYFAVIALSVIFFINGCFLL